MNPLNLPFVPRRTKTTPATHKPQPPLRFPMPKQAGQHRRRIADLRDADAAADQDDT